MRLLWRHTADLVLIDTPGLLSVPEAAAASDSALRQASEAAERIVMAQLAPPPRPLFYGDAADVPRRRRAKDCGAVDRATHGPHAPDVLPPAGAWRPRRAGRRRPRVQRRRLRRQRLEAWARRGAGAEAAPAVRAVAEVEP